MECLSPFFFSLSRSWIVAVEFAIWQISRQFNRIVYKRFNIDTAMDKQQDGGYINFSVCSSLSHSYPFNESPTFQTEIKIAQMECRWAFRLLSHSYVTNIHYIWNCWCLCDCYFVVAAIVQLNHVKSITIFTQSSYKTMHWRCGQNF